MNRFTRMLAVVGVAVLSASCGDNEIQELKALVDWNPEYTKSWAPAIGASLPALSVRNINGQPRNFGELTGEKGLLLFFVRSTNW